MIYQNRKSKETEKKVKERLSGGWEGFFLLPGDENVSK